LRKSKLGKMRLYQKKVKSVFSTYFSIESSNPKTIFCIINLVYWQVYRVEKVVEIFALSIEKIDFLIFSYFNLKAHLSALIIPGYRLRSSSCNFFWIPHSRINNPTLANFWFRRYFEKFLKNHVLGLKLVKSESFWAF